MKIPSVYFYVLPHEYFGYQHNIVSIAQGFKRLDIPYASSSDYWMNEDGSWLFSKDPNANPKDFDVVVLSEQYLTYNGGKHPEKFFQLPGKKVFIITADGVRDYIEKKFYPEYDMVLTFDYEGLNPPKHVKPWVYGVSAHMEKLSRPELEKEGRICHNYRNSHGVRKYAYDHLFAKLPKEMLDETREGQNWRELENTGNYKDYIIWQSTGRHVSSYLERLGSSFATATFGGDFYIKPVSWSWYPFKIQNWFVDSKASFGRPNRALVKMGIAKKHTYRIYQWDSWRFWESLVSQSAAIHVDFKQYHVKMPVMPENFKHYIGCDLKNPEKVIQLLKNEKERVLEIGKNAREWALKHYSAEAQAQRFLEYLDDL